MADDMNKKNVPLRYRAWQFFCGINPFILPWVRRCIPPQGGIKGFIPQKIAMHGTSKGHFCTLTVYIFLSAFCLSCSTLYCVN